MGKVLNKLRELIDRQVADRGIVVIPDIMANAGGTFTVSHVTLTFDDAAATNLPTAGQIISGTNKPSGNLPVKSFP